MRINDILTDSILYEVVLPFTRNGNVGEFNYGDGRTMKVEIVPNGSDKGDWNISFYPLDQESESNDKYDLSDANGEELSIFHTLWAFVNEWYNSDADNIEVITAFGNSPKRQSLYFTMARRMARRYGGKATTDASDVSWYSPAYFTNNGYSQP